MGLGKTLQAITVMWTLLEQGIYAGEATCDNGIVISPASLVANWGEEIEKWLGPNTIKCYLCTQNSKKTVNEWIKHLQRPINGNQKKSV